jgi:hypothetical protein
MTRLDWTRARKHRPTESILGSVVERRNGDRTPRVPRDDLARRAARELRTWQRSLSSTQASIFDEPQSRSRPNWRRG